MPKWTAVSVSNDVDSFDRPVYVQKIVRFTSPLLSQTIYRYYETRLVESLFGRQDDQTPVRFGY